MQQLASSMLKRLSNPGGPPCVILFESRCHTNALKMISNFRTASESIPNNICCLFCMIEDSPDIEEYFDVQGVPTMIFCEGECGA